MIVLKFIFIHTVMAAQLNTSAIIGTVSKIEIDKICLRNKTKTTCIKRTKDYEFLTSGHQRVRNIVVHDSIILKGEN